jgi:hypothetical protein
MATIMQGQKVQVADEMPETLAVLETRVVFPNPQTLSSQINSMQQNDATYRAALGELKSRNMALNDQTPPFGWTLQDTHVAGNYNKSFVMIQELSGGAAGSGQDLGLVTSVVQGQDDDGNPQTVRTVEFVLKPSQAGFNLNQIKAEVIARDGKAIAAGTVGVRDIFSRFGNCVRSSCAQVCLGALTGCVGAWPVYLQCVAVACGGCALKCAGCAGCDCGFWCKWAVGCCQG